MLSLEAPYVKRVLHFLHLPVIDQLQQIPTLDGLLHESLVNLIVQLRLQFPSIEILQQLLGLLPEIHSMQTLHYHLCPLDASDLLHVTRAYVESLSCPGC